jgi:hypothetical protein
MATSFCVLILADQPADAETRREAICHGLRSGQSTRMVMHRFASPSPIPTPLLARPQRDQQV